MITLIPTMLHHRNKEIDIFYHEFLTSFHNLFFLLYFINAHMQESLFRIEVQFSHLQIHHGRTFLFQTNSRGRSKAKTATFCSLHKPSKGFLIWYSKFFCSLLVHPTLQRHQILSRKRERARCLRLLNISCLNTD